MIFSVSRAAIAGLLGLSLAGCADSAPEMTDAQVLSLFGSTSVFAAKDAPKTVPRKAEDCVRLLAGLEEAVVKDMPQDALGQLKTACRQEISTRLRDEALNPMKLTLEHVETKEFADRLSAVRAKADEEAKAHAAKAAERREAEQAARAAEQKARRRQEQADVIKASQDKLALLKAEVPKLLGDAAAACKDLEDARKALRARNSRAMQAGRMAPWICVGRAADQALTELRKFEEQVAAMKIDENALFGPSMPYLNSADPENLRGQIEKVRASTAEMNAG